MKRKILNSLIGCCVALTLSACGGASSGIDGSWTNTGNPPIDGLPGVPTENPPIQPPEGVPHTSFSTIMDAMCAKITFDCHGDVALREDCMAGLLLAFVSGEAFGLNFEYTDFEDIQRAEENGEIQADGLSVTSCSSRLQSLSCDDPGVVAAFDPAQPHDYSKMAMMLQSDDGKCRDVFQPLDVPIGNTVPAVPL